jgi:hypothetical protein
MARHDVGKTAQGIVLPPERLAARTMEAMFDISYSLERYEDDHGGYPTLKDLQDGNSEFNSSYAGSGFMLLDAWGNEMRLKMLPRTGTHWPSGDWRSDGFLLVSAGSDGAFDASSWDKSARNDNVAQDLVLSDDGWVRWFPIRPPDLVRCCNRQDRGWPVSDDGVHDIPSHVQAR